MTSNANIDPTSQATTPALRSTLPKILLLLGLAVVVLLAAAYAYQLARQFDWLRTDSLIAILVSGIGATACLAGVMHLVDEYLALQPRGWYLRWPCFHLKQLLLIAEILTTGLTLAAAGILLFHFKIS